jgi:GMP synthase-like glutamine amidotransferase
LEAIEKRHSLIFEFSNYGTEDREFTRDLREYSGLIFLGADKSSADLPERQFERDLIFKAIKAKQPYLGICFGSQLLAVTLGSHLTKADKTIDHGVVPIQLSDAGLRDVVLQNDSPFVDVIHWHGECFDKPDVAEVLAYSTSQPRHVEIFRYGASVYGFQFHPEVTYETIEKKDRSWLPKAAALNGVKAATREGNCMLDHYFEEIVRSQSF